MQDDRTTQQSADTMPRGRLADLVLWPTLLFVYVIAVLQLGGFDDMVERQFFDPTQGGFPLKHNFWTEQVLHDGARKLMLGFALILLLAWLASLRATRLREWRRALGYLLVVILLSVGATNLGKRLSNIDCPWDLLEYGGDRTYYGLFVDKPDDAPRGRCFPGGHSSSGFALFGLFFLARGVGRPHAWLMLLPALALGGLFALDQWARGAHFPSHDLTTAYLCWVIALACYAWMYRERTRPGGQAAK